MLKREWCVESNGKLAHLFIPGKTVAWVYGGRPAFDTTAAMVPVLAVKDLPLGRMHWWWWWYVYTHTHTHQVSQPVLNCGQQKVICTVTAAVSQWSDLLLPYVSCLVTLFLFIINLCFRACQYLRSLAPIMNDFWWWWPMISRDGRGLRFPDICLTVEKKPQKNIHQENWPNWGSNPGPLSERQRCYPLTTAVVFSYVNMFIHLEYSSVSIMKYSLEQRVFIYDNFVKYKSWRTSCQEIVTNDIVY